MLNVEAQEKYPFYEQIALELYQTEIVDSFPLNKRIRIFESLYSLQETKNPATGVCLPEIIISEDTKNYEIFQAYLDLQLDWSTFQNYKINTSKLDKSIFKIKQRDRGKYPKLKLGPPTIAGIQNRVYINIFEYVSEDLYYKYLIEIDSDGIVSNWCRSEYYITRQH